ncbi:uncharacterized protein LOC135351157 [Halichondria panicea]|uniref:uncharacterized protein LOC135351157 n=1 Tax=Halichondria panicea TaxID=6063 RepID=UPI00312BB18C
MISTAIFILSATALAIVLLAHDCNGSILYVRPDNGSNTTCPRKQCKTLDQYANVHVSHLNNTQFIFMPGLHTLSKNFRIDSLMNIELISMSDSKNETEIAEIQCYKAAGFIFKNINFLTIKNLQISACGQIIPDSVYNNLESPLSFQAAVALKDVAALTMQSITIRDSNGYGIAAEGLYGYSTMEDCLLVSNTGGEKFIGGNLVLKYADCPVIDTNEQVYVGIVRSKFLYGSAHYSNDKHDPHIALQTKATGISLLLSCTNVIINMSEVQLKYNEAYSFSSKGGNLFILLGNTIQYTSNTVIVENSNIDNGTAVKGGGAYVRFKQPPQEPDNITVPCENFVSFKNVSFNGNKGRFKGGALYILFETASMYNYCPKGTVEIDSCYFVDNILNASKADSGLAINIYCYLINGVEATSVPFNIVSITRSHFLGNKLLTQKENSFDIISGGATVFISKQRRQTFISDSSFVNNGKTAISAFGSNIVFSGIVNITNNTGLDGGGLVLCQSSYILFAPNTTVTFENNRAILSGGGIYAEDQCLQSEPLCFYQVHNSNKSLTKHQRISILDTIHVVMINNTAGYAGSQIFGGFMDKCYTTFGKDNKLVYNKIFNEISWQRNDSDLSYITSYPKHICFCENKLPNCSKHYKNINITIYPGEPFTVSLVGVGQFNNPVPATIKATTSHSSDKMYSRTIKDVCTSMTFLVKSAQPTRFDKLSITVSSDLGYTTRSSLRSINIHYRSCPLGTYINNSACDYEDPHFEYRANSSTIKKNENTWVGYYNAADHSDSETVSGFIHFNYCPLWYCNNKTVINVNETYFDQNSQCHEREGILCGACLKQHSLAIASSRCLRCDNISRSYFPLLALATLAITALVLLFMLCCNVTITDGTVSGFLFYSSLFNINIKLFLRVSKRYAYLAEFFAWMNLDIGLTTCFYDGFDAFWQAILNFFIPVFIWCILGLIIFATSKSSRITELVGDNPVKVLATLVLISYTKILQTEVAVFSCSSIEFRTNSSKILKYYWLPDGNVPCWQGKHLALVVIGVLFGIATVLYTLMLLFIQPLQRYSHVRGLKWVAKLKPFFDAYTSPHVIKHRYRFWTGLLLLCRMINSISFALFSHQNTYKHYGIEVILICFLITSLLGCFGGVYKNKWLYALNSSFYFNLTLLSFVTFYSLTKNSSSKNSANIIQEIATSISLGIAFVTFLFILSYHVYKRLKKTGLLARCAGRIQGTRCWRSAVGYWNRGRIQYVRLPQEDPQDREVDDDFNGERRLDDDCQWERELHVDVQDRELNGDRHDDRQLARVCDDNWENGESNKEPNAEEPFDKGIVGPSEDTY